MIMRNVSENKFHMPNPKDLNMNNMYAMHGKWNEQERNPDRG